jgi:hypothetical protein
LKAKPCCFAKQAALRHLLTSAGVLLSTTARVRGSMTNSITAHHSIAQPPDPLETCSPAANQTKGDYCNSINKQREQDCFSWFRTCWIGVNRFASLESTPQQAGWELPAASRPSRLQLALMEVPNLCARCDDLAPVHSRAYRVRGASKLSCPNHHSVTRAFQFKTHTQSIYVAMYIDALSYLTGSRRRKSSRLWTKCASAPSLSKSSRPRKGTRAAASPLHPSHPLRAGTRQTHLDTA